jgi:hypothetical protein
MRPPSTSERIATLRAAFNTVTRDPAFIADAASDRVDGLGKSRQAWH